MKNKTLKENTFINEVDYVTGMCCDGTPVCSCWSWNASHLFGPGGFVAGVHRVLVVIELLLLGRSRFLLLLLLEGNQVCPLLLELPLKPLRLPLLLQLLPLILLQPMGEKTQKIRTLSHRYEALIRDGYGCAGSSTILWAAEYWVWKLFCFIKPVINAIKNSCINTSTFQHLPSLPIVILVSIAFILKFSFISFYIWKCRNFLLQSTFSIPRGFFSV